MTNMCELLTPVTTCSTFGVYTLYPEQWSVNKNLTRAAKLKIQLELVKFVNFSLGRQCYLPGETMLPLHDLHIHICLR